MLHKERALFSAALYSTRTNNCRKIPFAHFYISNGYKLMVHFTVVFSKASSYHSANNGDST